VISGQRISDSTVAARPALTLRAYRPSTTPLSELRTQPRKAACARDLGSARALAALGKAVA
jgi:hypothetical protein